MTCLDWLRSAETANNQAMVAWTHAWAHPSVLERRKNKRPPAFHDFAKDGDLTLVKNIGEDVADVADIVSTVMSLACSTK